MSKEPENMTKEELLTLVGSLQSQVSHMESQVSDMESQVGHMESEVSQMQFQLDQMKRLLYGAKRERFISNTEENQLSLPFDVPKDESPEKQQGTITYVRQKNKQKDHPGRMTLPDHLPVEEIILEPEEDTSGMKCIGKEVTDQLELVPAKLFIRRYIRPRYIALIDEELEQHRGVIAELPDFPIRKGIAGPGLCAQIMVDKLVDHLPIYRQLERFKREGIKISPSTVNGWQESLCKLLEPLYDTLKHRVLSQGYIQADETPIKVLDKQKKGTTHRGYHWIYHSPLEKMVFFDYNIGRSREGPKKLLENFKGYLQTDGYKAYDLICEDNEDIVLVNCMAHARRYFEKSLDYDRGTASYAMEMFQKLYAVEQTAREKRLSPEQRHTLRLDKSLPILNELGKWMVNTYKQTNPKSPIATATAYSIKRWDNLLAYLNDGCLEIDNNLAENAVRPVTLGRKNYLFAGSHRGAERAAMMYSFFGTCKKNNVNPQAWLKRVLEIIPSYKVNRLDELLPQNLKL